MGLFTNEWSTVNCLITLTDFSTLPGEIYAYIPVETDDWFCDNDDVYCNFDYGHSFGRGYVHQCC